MIDWHAMFVPTGSVLETILRGTLMYLALFLIMRFVTARRLGALNTADLLVIVLIADVSQNAFATDTKSLTEGVLLVLTILFWDHVIDWLGFRFPVFERLLDPPQLRLIEDGEINAANLKRKKISVAELLSQLRLHGVASVADVKLASLEPDGQISVVRFEPQEADAPTKSPQRLG